MPDTAPPPGFSFPGPIPKEALSYLKNKGMAFGFDYRDVWRQEHAYAFTVAKCMQIDVLQDIRDAVTKALEKGQTFAQFRKGLEPTLADKGWWGRKSMTDPLTGEEKDVQLGSPRRLKTIYSTNLRVARAAGQWQRAERTKAARPFFVYRLGPAKKHREQHVAWQGICLPVDDPFWDTHTPPCDYGCHCWLQQVTLAEKERMERDGVPDSTAPQVIDRETGLPTGHRVAGKTVPLKTEAPPVALQEWLNKRTGAFEMIPKGVAPGFDTNPGKLRLGSVQRVLTDKLEGADAMIAQVAIRDVMGSPLLDSFLAAPQGDFPMLRLSDAAADAIGARHRVAVMSADTVTKQAREHPEMPVLEYRALPDHGERPEMIVRDQDQQVVLVHRDGPKGQVRIATVKATKTGQNTFITSYRRANVADVERLIRRGTVLFGKWE